MFANESKKVAWLATKRFGVKSRLYSDRAVDTGAIVQISRSNIYRFGNPNFAAPVFRDVEWTIGEGENWAVIGTGSKQKTALLQTLLGHLRITPPPPLPGGLFPFLSDPPRDPHACVSLVSFAHRSRAAGGAFYDYTSRYGAVREEDRITLRESMFGEYDFLNIQPKGGRVKTPVEIAQDKVKKGIFEGLTSRLGLSSLLDLPLVALSNGQTRRARIVKAILSEPELLVLDEPLTGLDVNTRPILLNVLRSLHESRSPRIIMGLRMQDPIPDWISHVALVRGETIVTGSKDEILSKHADHHVQEAENRMASTTQSYLQPGLDHGKPVVDMKSVNVSYGTRKATPPSLIVLKNINWTIREGQRWHLQGANGSGKTTLLSLLTGDHPQSYTQRGGSNLELFSRPRQRIPTPLLRSLIGVVSPELANAYPRRAGVSVFDVVGTGFDGGFVPGGKDGVGNGLEGTLSDEVRQWRVKRVRDVLNGLGPTSWETDANSFAAGDELLAPNEAFSKRDFVDLSAGEQSIVLLMRALVSHPQLVLLDEVWSGMDENMVCAARRYLCEGGVGSDQAVVVISHWEEEVPWTVRDGLRRFKLEDGEGQEL
ncbi:P-loop containing nucleoside triphosphate hydrolase protein [Suillus paluster]|uniref:P-loop containing nucleoside triphosphate hydrolase protein n=1 Tax=Suillus paluster TaxID=48578 RepID=UPI001B8670EC|nr:P-loop containing nucleoside triphosphate hydrolase protein [Suillus paluster]KAG1726954.1 P-loop containing nucleoside triphosphate hydrolase protein [Suillus paluster]